MFCNIVSKILVCFCLCLPSYIYAATYVVTNFTSLVNAINSINANPGTSPSAGSNFIVITTASITATSNIPVLLNGVTIGSSLSNSTIDGGGTRNLFATFQASLALSKVTLANGLALGGNGGSFGSATVGMSGGGGGLGAGGGVYVDANQTLTLANTVISNCKAQGGAGGNGTTASGGATTRMGAGGGGASWSRVTSQGVNANQNIAGGDYYGQPGIGGGSITTSLSTGYGGGAGGSTTSGAGGSGGGSGLGSAGSATASNAVGGVGGYCGGGGGGVDRGTVSNNSTSGGGGGNGGGAGGVVTSVRSGGGGGGYGSGGGGTFGLASDAASTAGGGGGFGGGGGGGNFFSLGFGGGGGGGGWGGGGGGGGVGPAPNQGRGFAGKFGGDGGARFTTPGNVMGGGGGGAGVGGGIFLADGAQLIISDASGSSPATNITLNTTAGGAAGTGGTVVATSGSGVANNLFLFQNASVLFNGSNNLTVGYAIEADTTAPSTNIDAGIIVQTTSGASITLTQANTFQGPTKLNSGILNISADNNLGTAPSSPVATQITFNGGTLGVTSSFTLNANRGITLNSGGGTISTSANLTYNGKLTGTGALTKSGASTLILGGTTNDYTGGTTITDGILQVDGTNLPSTGAVNVTAGTLQFGSGTFPNVILSVAASGNASITGSCAPASASSNSGTITINSGGSFTVPSSFTSSSGTIAVANGGALTVDNALSGIVTNAGTTTVTAAFTPASTSSNSGTMNINSGGSFTVPSSFTSSSGTIAVASGAALNVDNTLSGIVTNAGTTTVTAAFTPASTSSNSGTMNINSGGSFAQTGTYTNTGTTNVNTNTPFASAVTGGSGSILNIGNTTGVTFTTSFTLANFATINLVTSGTNFTTNNAVLGLSNSFNVAANTTATIGASFAGSGVGVNNGSLTIGSAFGLANLTNNSGATLTFATGANNTSPITNSAGGIFNVSGNSANTATITNSGTMTVSAALSSGTIINTSGGVLTFNGANNADNVINQSGGIFNITGASTNTAAIDNSGTMTISANLSGSATITNLSGGTLAIQNSITIINSLINNSNAVVNVTGNNNIGTVTNHGTINLSISSPMQYDSLISSGVIDLSNSTLNVTSSYFSNDPGDTHTWTILTGSSLITTGATINIPATVGLNMWSRTITGTALQITYLRNTELIVPPGVAGSIAEVLGEMSMDITNPGQQELIDIVNNVTPEDAYVNMLNSMVPNYNGQQATQRLQNNVLSQLTRRVISRKANVDKKLNLLGFAAGDLNSDTSLWVASVGNLSRQMINSENGGYRARGVGTLFGVDHLTNNNEIFGVGVSVFNNNVEQSANSKYITRVLTVNFMAYGTGTYTKGTFVEWLLAAGLNKNQSRRPFGVVGADLSASGSYRSSQYVGRVNFGSNYEFGSNYTLSQLNQAQYMLMHQDAYSEDYSLAALNISSKTNSSLATLGTGFRLMRNTNDPWLYGACSVRGLISYDVLSPSQAITASFVVGSNDFVITSSPSRLALNFGADYGLKIFRKLQLQLTANCELRSKYYDVMGTLQLLYIL